MKPALRILGLRISRIPGIYDYEYGWNPLLWLECTQFGRRNRKILPWVVIGIIAVYIAAPVYVGFATMRMMTPVPSAILPQYYNQAAFGYAFETLVSLLTYTFWLFVLYPILSPVSGLLARRNLGELPLAPKLEAFVIPVLWLRFPPFLALGALYLLWWDCVCTFGNMRGIDLADGRQLVPVIIGVILSAALAMHIRIFFETLNYPVGRFSIYCIFLPLLFLFFLPEVFPGPKVSLLQLWNFVFFNAVACFICVPLIYDRFLAYVYRRGVKPR